MLAAYDHSSNRTDVMDHKQLYSKMSPPQIQINPQALPTFSKTSRAKSSCFSVWVAM